jgi:hypothetical protein
MLFTQFALNLVNFPAAHFDDLETVVGCDRMKFPGAALNSLLKLSWTLQSLHAEAAQT